jgi:hypothetical protein
MTRSIPFTQASLQRAIRAAEKSGKHVVGIRPDGTLLVADEPLSADSLVKTDEECGLSKWDKVRA